MKKKFCRRHRRTLAEKGVAQYLKNQKRPDSEQGLNRKLSANKSRCKEKKIEKNFAILSLILDAN